MCSEATNLTEWKRKKDNLIRKQVFSNEELNDIHDEVMLRTFEQIFQEYTTEFGQPPCTFVWFVTGSAGRKEQGILSDQDHGFIYAEESLKYQTYFLNLGQFLSDGLNEVGYPYCDGKVMSNNPLWCKSYHEWQNQLESWMLKESWESIRYLQIFYDSRKMYGNVDLVLELRQKIHDYKNDHPNLLKRFMVNVMRIKKGVGIFGQFFVERTGTYKGSVHLKHTMYLPYVNSIRLLAIKEGIQATSTLERIKQLKKIPIYEAFLQPYEEYFTKILEYRITLFREATTYEDVHYLNIRSLTKEERHEIKNLMRNGIKLYQRVKRIIEKGC